MTAKQTIKRLLAFAEHGGDRTDGGAGFTPAQPFLSSFVIPGPTFLLCPCEGRGQPQNERHHQ